MTYERFVQIVAQELVTQTDWISPDSLLVEELGVQSIDIVQIVEQVEREMGRDIASIDFNAVDTVEELFWEITTGGDDGGDSLVAAMADFATSQEGLPHELAIRQHLPNDINADVETLVGMLARRAAVTPDREAYSFQGKSVTYRQLAKEIAHMAAALQLHGVEAGDRVVLVMPNSAEFFPVFYGVQHLRATAAPIYHVPQPERIARIALHCGAKAVVTLRPLARPVRKRLLKALGDASPVILDVPSLATELIRVGKPLPTPEPDDLAMLQYTSGTTGDAKGVMLTHRALMANIRQIIAPGKYTRDDVFVSWLPVYHDLGLIQMTMCPLYLGAKLVILPVQLHSDTWLGTMEREGATITAAPDFAYRYVLRLGGNLDRYDLSSLRIALVAAEPVRARTVARFESALAIPGVLRPGYGLAEASVGVTLFGIEHESIIQDDEGVVAVGTALPGIKLDIRDESGESQPPGTHGEVCLRSPSQTLGYYRNDEATANLFTEDGYVKTGDIGYLDPEGMLFIVDRAKNIIIAAGRNFAPKELEQAADAIDGVVLAMAVGIDVGSDAGERLHMVVETDRDLSPDEQMALSRTVRDVIHTQMSIRPERVHVVPKNTIPRTYNGKLQYLVMRKRLIAGSALA